MHILIGVAVLLGILWVLTMTVWGRWVLAICVLLLMASGGMLWKSEGDYAVAQTKVDAARQKVICVPFRPDPNQRDPDVEAGRKLFWETTTKPLCPNLH